ncbi:prolactin receptor-like isoform X1 [Hoplias malabaricus]|uniref:prolactin receptor-like isoform X1 n=1 Tax=Hoplias malabaricus TaxID=27720 RepID=UPI00346293D2
MWGHVTLALTVAILLPWILPCKEPLLKASNPQLPPGVVAGCPTLQVSLHLDDPKSPTVALLKRKPSHVGGSQGTLEVCPLPTSSSTGKRGKSEKVLECPDYHSAGNNSCFFGKAHTSIWVIYNITVIATNAYGSTFSESVEVDVMDIVQPHSPENVTLSVVGAEDNAYTLVQWEAPHDTDTRSGWVTLKYQVRVKLENSRQEQASEWEVYSAGKQKELSIYSPQPGGKYAVQVRCRLDEGRWSEWSPPTFIQIPNRYQKEHSFVIFIATVSAIIFLITVGILAIKIKHVKHCLLPPVPGPKIKGLDAHLLKTKSEDLFKVLTMQAFPPAPECPDEVDYLVVVDEGDGKSAQEHQKKDQVSSDIENGVDCSSLSTENLNSVQSDRWIRTVTPYQECDPESTPGILRGNHSSQLNNQQAHLLSTHEIPLQALDPDQEGSLITSGKEMFKNPQSSCPNLKQNNNSSNLNGLMEYVDKETHHGKHNLTTEDGEDYSKVSGVYSDMMLVLQKHSNLNLKETACDDHHKKIMGAKTSPAKDIANAQEDYVDTGV